MPRRGERRDGSQPRRHRHHRRRGSATSQSSSYTSDRTHSRSYSYSSYSYSSYSSSSSSSTRSSRASCSSSSSSSSRDYVYHVLYPGVTSTEPSLATVRRAQRGQTDPDTNAGYTFPSIKRRKRMRFRELVSQVQATFGGKTPTVQRVINTVKYRRCKHVSVLLENHNTGDWHPASGGDVGPIEWVTSATLDTLHFSEEQTKCVRAGASSFLNGQDLNPGELYPVAWERAGWFRESEAWVEKTAADLGISLAGPVLQYSTSGLSCLLRVVTSQPGRHLYYKASAKHLFPAEADMTVTLGTVFPGRVPEVLAVHERSDGTKAVLLQDFGPNDLNDCRDFSDWERAISQYAQMQIESAGECVNGTALTEWMLSHQCADRTLSSLASSIKRLFHDTTFLQRMSTHMSTKDVQQLLASEPIILAMIQDLSDGMLPATIEHGDLHPGNCTLDPQTDKFIFYDWSDASVSHPFFSIIPLLDEFKTRSTREASKRRRKRERLLAAYISAWTGYQHIDELERLVNIAAVIGCLHQAMVYEHLTSRCRDISKEKWEGEVWAWCEEFLSQWKEYERIYPEFAGRYKALTV